MRWNCQHSIIIIIVVIVLTADNSIDNAAEGIIIIVATDTVDIIVVQAIAAANSCQQGRQTRLTFQCQLKGWDLKVKIIHQAATTTGGG